MKQMNYFRIKYETKERMKLMKKEQKKAYI